MIDFFDPVFGGVKEDKPFKKKSSGLPKDPDSKGPG